LVSLRPFNTLRTGGMACDIEVVRQAGDLIERVSRYQEAGEQPVVLGWGSNVLPADGILERPVVVNRAAATEWSTSGEVVADSGVGFQDLFLAAAQRGWGGLEFAVGIPGTLGGALVSNAGAYRSNISEVVVAVEVVENGRCDWRPASWMQFRYRDSVLRGTAPPHAIVARVRMQLPAREPADIYNDAREFQRQRIGKQPPPASAGSFFKSVVDLGLAQTIPGLTAGMRESGVIPAGFLIEAVGLKGHRLGGACLSPRHANFMLNVGGASATEIRRLAELAKHRVIERFGITMEEEVLYLGDWSAYQSEFGDTR